MVPEVQKGYAIESSNSKHEDDGFELRGQTQLRGTEADEHDMRMLGRIQQLNVRISHRRRVVPPTDILLAELSFYLYPGFCLHADEYMGDCTDVCALQLIDAVVIPRFRTDTQD